jgi:pantoate--beta-alanine ligase
LENKNFKVEYLELAKTNNLEIISDFKNKQELIILVAAFLNDVRLIDNLLINP